MFNGEIFNYVELRSELEAQGHRFYTQSDTEVIVHLYDRYGDRFVEHLNGQFAIALWDSERRRLVLARDRAGIRPLFYARERRPHLVRLRGQGAAGRAAAMRDARSAGPGADADLLGPGRPAARFTPACTACRRAACSRIEARRPRNA